MSGCLGERGLRGQTTGVKTVEFVGASSVAKSRPSRVREKRKVLPRCFVLKPQSPPCPLILAALESGLSSVEAPRKTRIGVLVGLSTSAKAASIKH